MDTSQYIESFTGGSLNTIIPGDNYIVKLYEGTIPRGAEKLVQEYKWLEKIPAQLYSEYPLIFPKPISFQCDPSQNKAEIKISMIPRISLSKFILGGKISPEQVYQSFESSMQALLTKIYPIRTGRINAYDGYYNYHAKRIALARRYLRQMPYFEPMLNAKEIIVNDIHCPTINQFLSWLDDNFNKIFLSTKLVAVHGNFHFDNILVDLKENIGVNSISFIDPRGDVLGYPHYDLAKTLTSIESYYDEIHYGLFVLNHQIKGNRYYINLNVVQIYNESYKICLNNLGKWIDDFSYAEEIDKEKFIMMINTVHCIHILSFTFYHAYQQYSPPDRIRAYIAIFALLSKRLIESFDSINLEYIPTNRLFLGGK